MIGYERLAAFGPPLPDLRAVQTSTPHGPDGVLVRLDQRSAYLSTVVTVDGRPAIEVQEEWGPYWVVTAWNPSSEPLTRVENAGRHAELVARLEADGLAWLPAVGSSPDGQWAEESVAIGGIDRETALALGRAFDQHAVFEVADELLRVHACFADWTDERPL